MSNNNTRHRLSVLHLPSGREFLGKSESLPPDELENVKNVAKSAARGELSFLQIGTPDGDKLYINEHILKDCIVRLEVIGW